MVKHEENSRDPRSHMVSNTSVDVPFNMTYHSCCCDKVSLFSRFQIFQSPFFRFNYSLTYPGMGNTTSRLCIHLHARVFLSVYPEPGSECFIIVLIKDNERVFLSQVLSDLRERRRKAQQKVAKRIQKSLFLLHFYQK